MKTITTKTKLTEENIEKISYCFSLGMSLDNSARYAGITPRTLRNWLKESEDSDDELLKKLADSISEARATFEQNMVSNLLNCAGEKSDWKGYSFMLQSSPQSKQDWANKSEKQIYQDLQRKLYSHLFQNTDEETANKLANILKDFEEKFYD